ncbi:MAG TPA: hypothetical protein VFB00_02525, partial [Terriglobales bacterium]|nr:hypothetical protein [Terriglobales bacterium]
MSYFNLELRPDQYGTTDRPHQLNRPYKGSKRFTMTAPGAPGMLIVHALHEEEAREHIINALFELIFHPRPGVSRNYNPACPYCGGQTHSHGRNVAGTRQWQCLTAGCQRYFVLNRTWKGGP